MWKVFETNYLCFLLFEFVSGCKVLHFWKACEEKRDTGVHFIWLFAFKSICPYNLNRRRLVFFNEVCTVVGACKRPYAQPGFPRSSTVSLLHLFLKLIYFVCWPGEIPCCSLWLMKSLWGSRYWWMEYTRNYLKWLESKHDLRLLWLSITCGNNIPAKFNTLNLMTNALKLFGKL